MEKEVASEETKRVITLNTHEETGIWIIQPISCTVLTKHWQGSLFSHVHNERHRRLSGGPYLKTQLFYIHFPTQNSSRHARSLESDWRK